MMCAAAKLCIVDRVVHGIWLAVPKATEWQRFGNQIDAAMTFARSDFVNVHFLRLWSLLLNGHFGRLDYGENLVALFEIHPFN